MINCYSCGKFIEWVAVSELPFAKENVIFCSKNCMLNKFAEMYSGLLDDRIQIK